MHASLRRIGQGTLLGAVAFLAIGCSSVQPSRLGRISARNVIFSQSGAWTMASRLTTQVESGRAGANGGQAAGCTSCR